MPPREWRLRIEDILEAIHKIRRYVSGLSFDEFQSDDKVVDAVVRNLEVIGEAARHIPPEMESRHPDLPWVEMRGMRNVLVHEYFGVNLSILWHTIQQNLPPIIEKPDKILASENE
ncbi:MAG: DUF86 domain-containing protein [Deltaproteobacteria bacterium CG2_30_66_27]|nr:MAG: DUF86 domain-containing protein [Deltaproteobacteria bacterium CG2_30_66_27]PJB30727.1 MAG: DUF86 domain-containing protein [Deltaproteobacteria bacterium CG_4_9_14_3_um_filter_65_9]